VYTNVQTPHARVGGFTAVQLDPLGSALNITWNVRSEDVKYEYLKKNHQVAIIYCKTG
jgi:hypothetical protein